MLCGAELLSLLFYISLLLTAGGGVVDWDLSAWAGSRLWACLLRRCIRDMEYGFLFLGRERQRDEKAESRLYPDAYGVIL